MWRESLKVGLCVLVNKNYKYDLAMLLSSREATILGKIEIQLSSALTI